MPRPLMQSRIGDLEEMFASSRGMPDALKQLEHELQFRQVPRAVALLELVQRAKAAAQAKGVSNSPAPARPVAPPTEQPRPAAPAQSPAPPTTQLSLLGLPAVPQTVRLPIDTPVAPVAAPAQPPRPSAPAQVAPALPTVSVEDAYRLLKLAPGATWEAVEQARRTAVQKSSPLGSGTPAAHPGAALAAARLANEASAALAASRMALGRA
jgi:hypothetical protein